MAYYLILAKDKSTSEPFHGNVYADNFAEAAQKFLKVYNNSLIKQMILLEKEIGTR